MNLIKTLSKLILAAIIIITVSCERNDEKITVIPQPIDTLDIIESQNFLFNIPISYDTVLIDKEYNNDFRVEIEGYSIDSVFIIIDSSRIMEFNTSIISTKSFYISEGTHSLLFIIRSVDLNNGDTLYFKSKLMNLLVMENLSNRYVKSGIDNGRLKLTWPELDKMHTKKYLVERFMGENMEYSQEFEIQDPMYIDNYYVGEGVNYKISIINNEGNKQNIWYYKKSPESPSFSVSQNPLGGYNIYFSKCKYFNNFGQYYLTTGMNYNPELIFSSSNITDTSYHFSNAIFADEVRLWLRYLPKDYPSGVSNADWMLYGKFLFARYGISNFNYDRIAILNKDNIVYTSNGNIFKQNINTNQTVDSIINKNAAYGFLRATPAGNYIYAIDENKYGSPLYLWSSNKFSTNPDYAFHIDFIIPPVSDNLIAFMSVPSNTTSSKLAIYNATNGSNIYTTEYESYGSLRRVSSNGQYFLTDQSGLKLFSYSNNTFKSIYVESDWLKYYKFFDFNPLDNGICYVWDSDKKFSIRRTSDFSEIASYSLELEEIINIDYYSRKIMGYMPGYIKIYNLDNGTLETEIPANLSALFFSGNNSILVGNVIFSNQGIKYIIK